MSNLPAELAILPDPELIEDIGYEQRLAVLLADLVAIFAAAGITYDVDALETDPAKILLEVAAYADINLRQRINEAFRANLLPYALGGDLDILAQFYDVTRLSGEGDAALRTRVVLAIRGRSTGGTAPRYKSIAMGADVRVADVAVYTVDRDPTVHIAVFATDNGGVPDQALLDAVDAAVQDAAVRMVNDTIVTGPAARVSVDVEANIWLLPGTSNTLVDALADTLSVAWAAASGLGFDMTLSWLTKTLMQSGVQRVEIVSPAADIVTPFNEALALGTIILVNRGRDY